MIRTEKEASSCVCPIISRPQDGGVSFCVSSKCMSWRWATQEDAFKTKGHRGTKDEPEFYSFGFCGLAGRP